MFKTYLVKLNLEFQDLFFEKDSQEDDFDVLIQLYLENPTDENFCNALSHPLCEQKDRFVEIESFLAFPKKSFEHFPLTKKKLHLDSKKDSPMILANKHSNKIKNFENVMVYSMSILKAH